MRNMACRLLEPTAALGEDVQRKESSFEGQSLRGPDASPRRVDSAGDGCVGLVSRFFHQLWTAATGTDATELKQRNDACAEGNTTPVPGQLRCGG